MITVDEALSILQGMRYYPTFAAMLDKSLPAKEVKQCEQRLEAVSMAIEALRKEQPLKPLVQCTGGTENPAIEYVACPACLKHCYLFNFNRCPECGQVFDWSDLEIPKRKRRSRNKHDYT